MVKKIIFLMSVKYFENKDWNQFGCQYFLDMGYDLEIWSLVKIHYKGKAKKPLHFFKDYEVKYFEDTNGLKNEIKKNKKKETVFIIYPSLGEDYYTKKGYYIRWLIRKLGYQYCDYFYPPYPSYINFKQNIPTTWKTITKYYINNLNRDKFFMLLFSIIAPPRYVFVTAKAKLCQLANRYDLLKRNKLIHINTFDYDEFMKNELEEDVIFIEREGLKKDSYIVFIDQALTHHSDYANAGLEPCVTEKIYGNELRRFFNLIEVRTGMEVVIALHPKAEYKDLSLFGIRKTIQGNTRCLIKYCNFVITYCSTSISYIMLYKKKILIYYTNELLENEINKDMVFIVAKILGCCAVNISNKIPEQLFEKYIKLPEEKRIKEYIEYYVTFNQKRKVTSYQVINQCLKKIDNLK